MSRFESRNVSEADVPASPAEIWAVLSDPDLLARFTPLIKAISTDGDLWCWQLSGISALGVSVAPSFSERMHLVDEERIDFRHDPPAGASERAGADGTYTLTDLGDGVTRLFIDITIWVDLPLPRLSRRAVERVMDESMERTGDRFAANLYRHLDIDPGDVVERTPAA
ncbi:SRPBCC family protein [Iamia majanohamensis]|uniref:SRPBCC family protein n=1 Tax=Iamia majanohamensis TaxID=467976 RepID=A0AAE9Y700_9ACTN|nr:SRPBCC family protein [Iamia majanohamensis]WCO65444.1 SRPBCC family protein [Iamia majanohamensis]